MVKQARGIGVVVRGATSFATWRVRRLPLLPAVVLAVGGGVLIAVAADLVLTHTIRTSRAAAAPIDVTKLALTVVGGVGGVVALVIAYRRQRDLEQGRFVERFGAAAAQLGASDVAVRIAGVYAMAGVADESSGLRRQQCVDVLCGYLRLPYDATHGNSGRTKLVVKTRTSKPSGESGESGELEEHIEYRQNDKTVRRTILLVIGDHLRREAKYSWSTSDFDFSTAHLEDVTLGMAVFSGDVSFEKATFSGDTWLWGATFSRGVDFEGATFDGDVVFSYATCDYADFGKTTFNGDAVFEDTTFSSAASFNEAVFSAGAHFGRPTFYQDLAETKTDSPTAFSGHADFGKARFSAFADFGETVFSEGADFTEAAFAAGANFKAVGFGREPVKFTNPEHWGPPAPTFDWDADPTLKPSNVIPEDWPPSGRNWQRASTPPL